MGYKFEILSVRDGSVSEMGETVWVVKINGVTFTYEQWYTRNSGGEQWYKGEPVEGGEACNWPPDELPEELEDGTFDESWEAAREAYIPPPTAEERAADLFNDAEFCDGIGPAMTCTETEILAAWLRNMETPRNDAADTLIAAHCVQDDEGDDHCLDTYDDIDPAEWPSWVKLVKDEP